MIADYLDGFTSALGKCWSETVGPGPVAIMTNGTTHETMLSDGVDRERCGADRATDEGAQMGEDGGHYGRHAAVESASRPRLRRLVSSDQTVRRLDLEVRVGGL